MKNIIAGTAGHIDHGKTALVRALTGIDTDRLEEEKRRGISIDLGFAHLELPGLRVGFVDVPGHERFVRNMLAGAAGIDLVLLVIAADESIKPQTREHFDICRLLGVERGIVVLTKADLADPDTLALVKLEVEDFVRGTFLEGAPVVPVSSVTGAGLDDLKRRLAEAGAAVRGHVSTGHFRLAVDRSFSLRGFGTVVTGTLSGGSLRMEEEVEVHPTRLRLRVRGLQVHGAAVDQALPGQRTAVNLAGVEATELHRGMALATPGLFHSTRAADVRLELLPSAVRLKHGAPVHFHAGTAETAAEVRLLGDRYARLLLRDPVLLWPGDRFIIRRISPVTTIGGGVVLDSDPPKRLRRAASLERAKRLDAGASLAVWTEEARFGLRVSELVARTGRVEESILREASAAGIRVLALSQDWLIPTAQANALTARMKDLLIAFHASQPLQRGMNREEVRKRLFPGAPPGMLEALLPGAPDIVADGDFLRLATHKVALQATEDAAAGKIEKLFRDAGLAVPAVAEVLSASGVAEQKARTLLQILLREKKLVRVNMELVFHAQAIEELRGLMASRKGQRFSVAEFKEWTRISRKFAIPLLEFLDRERVTRRDGDQRVVL